MGKIYKNAAELVGNTPLLEVGNIEKDLGLEARFLLNLSTLTRQEVLRTVSH